jgi:hypothetical protein
VRLSFFRTYDEGSHPKRLHLLARHVQNHFEVPPLLHLGVLLGYASGCATPLSVGFAWLFVVARLAHSFVHLGSNNVSHRFLVFGTSLLLLCGLWIALFVSLLRTSASAV